MRTLISNKWNMGGCLEHWDECLRRCAAKAAWWGHRSPGLWPGTSEHPAPAPRSPSQRSNRSVLRWCSLAALSLQTEIRPNPTPQGHIASKKNHVPNSLKSKASLTSDDGLHFALAAHTAAVCCIDVAVVFGGGLQVFHHCAGVGEGHIECLFGDLRSHQQVVKFCWGDSTPLDHDGCAGNCPSVCYLWRVRNWVMRAENSFKGFRVIVSLYCCML